MRLETLCTSVSEKGLPMKALREGDKEKESLKREKEKERESEREREIINKKYLYT